MPIITRALLRKRAEHNEGIISTLEEISLHQEELESINDVLGSTCRKLKILYLQNNIIPKMENLHHLKDLEYLNLALNNISKIEGLQNCEFLNKLDLTVNFIDLDDLESSISHLSERNHLRDLYMMGNPSQTNWSGFNAYLIARIPHLMTLDGTEITRSMRILALQQLPKLEAELRVLATECAREKASKREQRLVNQPTVSSADVVIEDDVDETVDSEAVRAAAQAERDRLTDHSPETRNEIYRELAQQKKEKADREAEQRPKERNYEAEHQKETEDIRKKEETANGDIKQKNEGQWEFRWDETVKGQISLEVMVTRHLDSSLIDVDVHPAYVSIVIKGRLLRLVLPAEVRVSDSKCQRSKASGSLLLIMPMVNPKENVSGVYVAGAAIGGRHKRVTPVPTGSTARTVRKSSERRVPLQEQMLAAAAVGSVGGGGIGCGVTTVDYRNIVPKSTNVTDTAPSTNIPVRGAGVGGKGSVEEVKSALVRECGVVCSPSVTQNLLYASTFGESMLAID